MKLFYPIIFLAISYSLSAQGLKLGVDLLYTRTLINPNTISENRYFDISGISYYGIGVKADHLINRNFGLRTGLNYVATGYLVSIDDVEMEEFYDVSLTYKAGYFSFQIPIEIFYRTAIMDQGIQFSAGTAVNFTTLSNIHHHSNVATYNPDLDMLKWSSGFSYADSNQTYFSLSLGIIIEEVIFKNIDVFASFNYNLDEYYEQFFGLVIENLTKGKREEYLYYTSPQVYFLSMGIRYNFVNKFPRENE